MKKTLVLCAAIAGFAACSDVKKTEEYQTLLRAKATLEEEVAQQEKTNRETLHFIMQIENNLAAIREREMGIVNVKNDPTLQQEDRIILMVAEIGTYFEENRNIIKKLEGQIRSYDRRNNELIKLVALQKDALLAKEKQIEELLQQVEDLNAQLDYTVSRSNEEIQAKDAQLSRVRQVLNEKEKVNALAYYKYGSRKELAKKGIISKDGGVLGIGKTITVSPKLNPQSFTPLDTRVTSEIPLGDIRKQRIVTTHPGNSYKFVKAANGGSFLKITHPEKFWSVSRYLVVVVD
jgi:hypothetical protein